MSSNLAAKRIPAENESPSQPDAGLDGNKRLVRPSDSTPLNDDEIVRVKSLLQELDTYIRPKEERGGFKAPGGLWDRNAMPGFFEYSRRLFEANSNALRYFRFLCITFSGWSVYHNDHSRGLALPDINNLTEQDADLHWRNPEFPHTFYQSQVQLTHNLPPGLIFQPPLRLGEAGWIKDGRVISYDQRHIQERLSLLYYGGLIEWLEKRILEHNEIRILEIGGGYGALALGIKNYFPQASYTIIDLPDSLAFSGTYLTLTRPDLQISVSTEPSRYGVRLVPIALAENLNEEFDLVINTLSMSEMTKEQVDNYCRLMVEKWIPESGYFFEQNGNDVPNGGLCIDSIVEKRLDLQVDLMRSDVGKPNIWQSPGANSGKRLKTRIPDINLHKVMDIGQFTICRSGALYYLIRGQEALGGATSMENIFQVLARFQQQE